DLRRRLGVGLAPHHGGHDVLARQPQVLAQLVLGRPGCLEQRPGLREPVGPRPDALQRAQRGVELPAQIAGLRSASDMSPPLASSAPPPGGP
ncbi:hypothetical protein, partial [Streptomyces narbonensis]